MPARNAPAPRPGLRLGEYVLDGPLGEGGFATVWEAHHHAWPERKAAAKIIRDPDQVERLKTEGRCLALLSHPHIAQAVGLDLDHDPPYLLVELHAPRTLRDLLNEVERLAPDRAFRLFAQVVAAVAHSHSRGIAHGDLKPENVLIGADDYLKVTDFGLGQIRATEASLHLSGELKTQAPGVAETLVERPRPKGLP